MWVSNTLASFIIIISTLYINVDGAEIWCYPSNINSHATYSLENPQPLLYTSYYKADAGLIIITHGYGESATYPSVTTVADAYIRRNDSNVCALDWSKEASNPLGPINYPIAVKNAMDVGAKFHQTLIALIDAGVDPDDITLIGHSLGAPLFGEAGRGLTELVKSLVALDPAGPAYEGIVSFRGADTTSAKMVKAIHTNPGRLGSFENEATVDIDFNCWNPTQPGCTGGLSVDITSEQNKCSHSRSYLYFAEAINNPYTFIARLASGCPRWKEGGGGSETISIEQDLPKGATGRYFLQTNPNPPYGRGNPGSYYQNI